MAQKFIHLKKTDKEIAGLIEAEIGRQTDTLNLIPSENIVSEAVLEALGSPLTNKYSEGYPGRRYYGGNEFIDTIELLAQARAKKVFGLSDDWHVNVQALSGSPANMAVYYALLRPQDKIMGMSLPFGGHLTHGWKVSASGRFYASVQYGVGKDGLINYDEVAKLAQKERPHIIVAGATAYSRVIDFKKFAEIASNVNAYFMVDMAHIAGLIAAGAHPSPFPHADVVTTTTHKTLRGPRGALIFTKKVPAKYLHAGTTGGGTAPLMSDLIDKAIFPALQGGPHDNQTAAIAVSLGEALKTTFKTYGSQIVKNARALAAELQRLGLTIVSGGTDTHLMLIDLTSLGISGKDAQNRLEAAGIIVNRNTIPYDPRSPFDPSGIRIGTPALTTRGMKEKEMKIVAVLIHETLTKKPSPAINKKVKALCKKFR